MEKRVGLIGGFALLMVLYLIWQDPDGMADLVRTFFDALGGFLGDAWDRLGEFFKTLADG